MSHQYTKTAVSRKENAQEASREIQQALMTADVSCVVFFCSAQFDLEELGRSLAQDFGSIPVFGCTSAGEITPQGYERKSIIAIGFCQSHFNVKAQLISSMETFDYVDAQTTVRSLTKQTEFASDSQSERFILTLLDGLSVAEERFLNTLHLAAGDIEIFGGSAGDDVNLAKTYVYFNGEFHQHSAIILMFNTSCHFEVFSTNHIEQPQEKLVVTEADSSTRTIFELNAEPAALEYARLLNLSVSELTPQVFSLNPLAVKVGGEYYFRSIQKVNEADNSLTFYCAVDTGIVLTAVDLGNVFSKLDATLRQLERDYGCDNLVLACDCFLRRLEIEHKGLEPEANNLFKRHNIIGFNTYGEQINGVHLNQTLTGVFLAGARNE